MLKLNLRLGLCLAYAQFLGLFQPGYTYRVYAYKKKSVCIISSAILLPFISFMPLKFIFRDVARSFLKSDSKSKKYQPLLLADVERFGLRNG